MEKINEIEFNGPFNFAKSADAFNEHNYAINGVYLWCIQLSESLYRAYYVGEAVDINKRMKSHLKKLLEGQYSGHSIELLREKKIVIMHRACEGMIARFSHINRKEFNKNLSENLYFFYASVPECDGLDDSKWLRCRYESAIIQHIQNQGENILCVGHMRYWKGEKLKTLIKTKNCTIESLTNETITV